MEWIPGFAWPVPRAFSGAVSACRFEQGDVFYSDSDAYDAWGPGGGLPAHAIQVLDPPKGTRALAADADGKRFFANWVSPVEIRVWESGEAAGAGRVTTQGRLFTGLWRGDVAWLAEDAGEPEPPAMQRDLHKRLAEAVAGVRARVAAGAGKGGRRRHGEAAAAGGCLYLAAVDEASDAGRVKAGAVAACLAERFPLEEHRLAPGEVGIEGAERFHPALVVQVIAVATDDPAPVEALLSELLYAGSATGAGEGAEADAGESAADGARGRGGRFSLARHGLLVAPGD